MMFKKYNIYILLLTVVSLLAVGLEVLLRAQYGLGKTLLFTDSKEYEYIAAPNQDLVRFGNKVLVNEYGMRSLKIEPSDTTVILLIGDSVINGGVLTDHDSLATTILEKELSQESQREVRVLNISAGSWGPDNCYAYLEKHGVFNADMVVLVASSHDAHDNMEFKNIVGVHASYPTEQPMSAVSEFFSRYVWSRYVKKNRNNAGQGQTMINKEGKSFNTGFGDLKRLTDSLNIPFTIYLHPERKEVKNGAYNQQGNEIVSFAHSNNIQVLEALSFWNEQYYRDQIHPNCQGQRQIADLLKPLILEKLNEY
ncbi:hypothetical protein RCC89_08840 [Cytophagaceae bacterium ABcell3]|nr:hypothetical protein RCC89_08840 [Cytophagaceae bacterium ABcell3]